MKTIFLLSAAGLSLFLSSCASYHQGFGPGRGYGASTVAIQANRGFGVNTFGYGGLGFNNFYRPVVPVRSVVQRGYVQPRQGYYQNRGNSVRHGVPVNNRTGNRNGYQNQRSQTRPSSTTRQRSTQRSSGGGSSRGVRNGGGGSGSRMTMASSRSGGQRRGR